MWEKAYDTAERCLAEARKYHEWRYDKTHKEPDFREGEQVLFSTLNLNKLKGQNKMRYSFVQSLTIIEFIGKNAVDLTLTEEFARKYAVFPKEESHPTGHSGKEGVTGPVKKVMKARKIRLNGKDHRKYLVRSKNQKDAKDKLLAEDAIPHAYLHLRRFRASRRAEKSQQ
ncbi:hypothetical protein O181_033451 [Austropuccinia psidii MF-1]|uniref:Uncharacterized protein n=1 Tax=Austropuccinia psidii MF-1 TaxID=1389203 RepID=A0A9Q3H740_9BASI|nr:hypothetical protein [Austropuccinia psidii MF-1]